MGALNLGVLDCMDVGAIEEVLESWSGFSQYTDALLLNADGGAPILGEHPEFEALMGNLCRHGLSSLARDHFWQSLEAALQKNVAPRFWSHFSAYNDTMPLEEINEAHLEGLLIESLEEICFKISYHEKCLMLFLHSLQPDVKTELDVGQPLEIATEFLGMHKLMVSSVLLNSLPPCFPDVLSNYFRKKLEYLSVLAAGKKEIGDVERDPYYFNDGNHMACANKMDIDGGIIGREYSQNRVSLENMGKIVRDLGSIGFTSIAEDAYASAVFLLLKAKVHSLALEDYRNPVLEVLKKWIQEVPLQFLHGLLTYLGDPINHDAVLEHKPPLASSLSCLPGISAPSERLIKWQLRLEYFAYETLQDLRINKLFEIIVDYPDSSSAIEDLRQCLEYTGQHSKLVNSFITSLRYRLLTAGASTNDILHQYVSTIKALRTIDPTGIFLEAVGAPIRDYLRGRKDTIKCIVTMLTDGAGGNANGTGSGGDSLLEELNRDAENRESADCDDDFSIDDKQSWVNFESWEPDPVEADASKHNRSQRKLDILGMIVGIIGSKDQLVNEYRVMLAEKLLNKSNYDVDTEIRTLELLKIHFGESSMQKCEIMLNDFIDSKRTNTNIKASKCDLSQSGDGRISLDRIDTTIISSNFWPTIQSESFQIPAAVDQLLSDYSKRYHEIKAPRRLSWIKNLGTVELELQFEGRTLQLTVAPVHAAIIMKFEEQACWNCDALAVALGLPVDSLIRKISFWVGKGIVMESFGENSKDIMFTLVDQNKNDVTGGYDVLLSADEEGERPVASVEEQLQKEMTVFENFIIGMLTNFGNMTSDRIHNTLKMFCVAEPAYDKSLQQLQSFLSSLVSDEKLEMRDGSYYLKK